MNLSRGFKLGDLAERNFRQGYAVIRRKSGYHRVQLYQKLLNAGMVATPVGFAHSGEHFKKKHFRVGESRSELENFLFHLIAGTVGFPNQENGVVPLQSADSSTHCGNFVGAGVDLIGKDFHRGAFGEHDNIVVHWSLTSLMVRPSRSNIVTAFENL